MWTSMCPGGKFLRCTRRAGELRSPSIGYPVIFYLAIKLFIECITFTWWQKITEKGPSCLEISEKTSVCLDSWGCFFHLLGSGQWLARKPTSFTWIMGFPSSFRRHVYLCYNNYSWKISHKRLTCSIAFPGENNRWVKTHEESRFKGLRWDHRGWSSACRGVSHLKLKHISQS